MLGISPKLIRPASNIQSDYWLFSGSLTDEQGIRGNILTNFGSTGLGTNNPPRFG